ncbi:MAG: hypothetical protein RLZZ458_698, partial [Planctomycetota bacterium]
MSENTLADVLRTRSRRSLLRAEVLWPVLLVGGLWLVMSLGTNAYLNWVETEYTRLFDDNLQALRLTTQAESEIWRLSNALDGALGDSELRTMRSRAVRQMTLEIADFQRLEGVHLRSALGTFQAAIRSFLDVLDGSDGVTGRDEFQVRLQGLAAEVSRS